MKTVDINHIWVAIDFYVMHTKMVDLFVIHIGCSYLRYSHVINTVLHNE